MNDDQPTRLQRGEATRANILAAARQRFAADGYERATIRAIAADAGIDPSLVMRYFGSKQGLFVAAADIELRIPDLSSVPHEKLGAALVEHFVLRWDQDDILPAILRAAATNAEAAERMRCVVTRQAIPAVTAVCGGDRATAEARSDLISSQFLGFAYCRYVLELPPLVAMGRDEIVSWLGPTVQRYLFGPHE